MLVVDTTLAVMNLSFWHESLRRGQRGWCALWKQSPERTGTLHSSACTTLIIFETTHGFYTGCWRVRKMQWSGLKFTHLCPDVVVLNDVVSCCHAQSCPEAEPGSKSQSTVWEIALHLALDLVGMKECSHWGEEVWVILRSTCDKRIFETSWCLFDCYFMVERPDKDLRIPFFQVQT